MLSKPVTWWSLSLVTAVVLVALVAVRVMSPRLAGTAGASASATGGAGDRYAGERASLRGHPPLERRLALAGRTSGSARLGMEGLQHCRAERAGQRAPQ